MKIMHPVRTGLSFLLAFIFALSAPPGAVCADTESKADPRIDIINGAELTPQSPQSKSLDAYLDELLPELITEDMDTYDQVKACYDYLVQNTAYGSHTRHLGTKIGKTTCRKIYNNYGEVEGFGAVALTAHVGMCNAYSAAFILMVRKIGLDAKLVEGSTKSAGGGYSYHKWTEITIGETVYAFDPQLEQNLVKAGLPAYSVFCKTYEQIPGRYRKR